MRVRLTTSAGSGQGLRTGADQASGDDQALDLGSALVDLGHLRVAVVAFHRELARVAIAAEDLDRVARDAAGDGRGEELGLRALDRVGMPRVLRPRGLVDE